MKRVFALVVCLCMVFAMVPAASAATGDVSLNGNAIYETVEQALAAAAAGDTVTLNADVTAGQVIVPKGVTLDLGGYNLEAALVIAMNGQISGQGNVVVAEDMLKVIGDNGGNLAVWDAENGTYSFTAPTYQQLMNVAEDLSYANYIFVPYLDEATTAMLANGGADNGISVKVLLTWNEGQSQQIYTFSDELVSQVYGSNYKLVFQLTITGFAGIEDMTACAVVESAAGGKAANIESDVGLPKEPVETQPAETEPVVTEPAETEPAGPSGEIAIESYGNAEWIAPQDGYVKFTINVPGAQLAVLEGFSPLAEGYDAITVKVNADTTYGVYPAFVDVDCVVTWEYVAAPEGGDDEGGDAGEVVPSGEALALGNNNVTLTYATMPMAAPYWTYTATEPGYLTVTVTSINGESNLGMAFGRGMYTLLVGETDGAWTNTATVYMNAYETVNIAVLDQLDMTEVPAVINLSFAAGSDEPVVEKNPADYFDMNDEGQYVIGSLETPVDIFVSGSDDIYFVYVAEADGNILGTATVEGYASTNCAVSVNGGSFAWSVIEANVAAGDVVIINIWGGYEGTLSFEAGEYIPTEPAEPEETEPALPGTMDNPYVIDELPYNVYFYGYMDEYYSYTATEEGNIIVSGLEGALLSLPWGDYWEEDENGNYIIPVIADYELMMNFWTFAEEIDGFMTITFQPAASEPEATEPVETEPVETEPVETEPAGFQVVDAPVAGTAYKFGMIQKNVSETDVYYLDGNISGYYMATTTDAGAAVDVYLEETDGGYYLYAMVNGAKQYINMVVSGTYVNGKYEDAAATVYTYNEDSKTVIAVVNDTDYWMGTRNDKTYTTVGPVKTSYNGFYMQFYAEATTEPEAPVEPSVPVETEPVETDPAADSVLTVAEAIALGASKAHNTYTAGKYYVTGEITEVYNTTYGNMRIKDEAGNILTIYGSYNADGTVGYSAMDVKPVAGDTVTVYGIVGQYNGTAQIKNGWIVAHTAAAPEATEPVETEPVDPEAGNEIVFVLGADSTAAHVDGNAATNYTESNGSYTLQITASDKMYTGAVDAKGNGCIKLGTSSVVGGFSFTVADDVTSVKIAIAKYKAKTSKVDINGTTYTLANSSNDGAYDVIEIDTSSTKTITLTTVSGSTRVMVNSITFVIAE